MRGSHALAVSIGLGALFPIPASAQNVHISRLYEQVLENIEFANEGHVLNSFGVMRLNEDATSRVALDVPVNASVQIMGDCDEDCADLDLTVYNFAGKQIAQDTADDFYPIVVFESGENGRIEIELDLAACEARYCYAAYSVFVRAP